MAERDDALARFNAAMAARGYAPPALRLELQQRIAELEAEVARLREYGLMALDLGQLDCQCEDDGMCGMCLLRNALVGKGE